METLDYARRTLELEADAIRSLIPRLDSNFTRAVETIFACAGRVVVTGMGKSGAIARKLAATFASTGTPAHFLHPAEGGHGDLGMVVRRDVVVAISTSGETEELKLLIPALKRLEVPIVALCGRRESTLARESAVVVDIAVQEEACPMGLAPTTSTTAALAMADALAVAVLCRRDFTREDFAVLHPSGTLGRQLLLRVGDLMHRGADLPAVPPAAGFAAVLTEMTGKRLGCTAVVNADGTLAGIVTDGDLRRAVAKAGGDVRSLTAAGMMTRDPKTVTAPALAATALQRMGELKITALFVTDEGNRPVGLLHIHDILAAGIR